MREITPDSEKNPLSERYSKAGILEYLFPGNRFADLPRVNIKNVNILWKLYTVEEDRRRLNFIEAITDGREFVEREDFAHPDQLTMAYYTKDLEPFGKATHPTMFQNHSFADIVNVQEGERIGGVAIRPVSWYRFSVTQLALRMGDNPYIDKPELILGVLDKDNKPCAIIHFGEGTTPRRPKCVEEDATVVCYTSFQCKGIPGANSLSTEVRRLQPGPSTLKAPPPLKESR